MTEKTFQKYKAVIDEWLINGRNGTKAYHKIYPKSKLRSSEANFRKILAITRIAEYVKEKTDKTAQESQITFESRLKKLEELMNLSETSERYSDAINAIKEQNKMLGHYAPDKHDVQGELKIVREIKR